MSVSSERKKILWLSHVVPFPPIGGVLQRSHNLLKEVANEHEVFLCAFIQEALLSAYYSSVSEGIEHSKQALGELCELVEFVEIPSERKAYGKELLAARSLFSRLPYTINWLQSEKMAGLLVSLRDTYDFDLIYFDTVSLVPFRDIFSGVPAILNHHNIESDMMFTRSSNERNLLKKFYFYQEASKLLSYEKRHLEKFDLHTTCSVLDSARLKNIESSIVTAEIPNGVNLDFFAPNRESVHSKTLIFAGGLGWYPNRDAMMFFAYEIWPLLKARVDGVEMHVLGKDAPEQLKALANADSNFHVHGFVDDIRPYINQAAIYACPIRDGGGTKLKILDALAMQIPIVACEQACEGIDMVDGEHMLIGNTKEAFVDRVCELIESEDLALRLAANGRKLVERSYSFTSIGRDLAAAMSRLAG